MSPASLTLSQANNPTSDSFTDFIHKFRDVTGLRANPHRSPDDCMGVLESFTDWRLETLPDLEKVELKVRCLTESWARWILNLIHTCPTLKEVELHTGFEEGLLLEEGISLLQESNKRPDCTVILNGRRCTKPSGKCGEGDEPKLDCNQRVKIQMRGSTEEEI
ncbi:NACHT, LRR and PYD domains-containing protein 1 homolog [Clupea harengus]|uniref:NACHT, LRR and PYD domains-containing protein 1 homolog n=1 Tax=Clupea harengus TaxID=7950 RepID=A0A8M1KNG7_CLUHA|nr:NACHT, LRR and PYD domains-containing protein 1 homolog [Clupea harengus]